MNFWTYNNLAKVTQGTWRTAPTDGDATLPAAMPSEGAILCHDTRELTAGQCYLAIKGENFDGHNFINQTFAKGASLAIVDANSPPSDIRNPPSPILAVPDALFALQELARAYRNELATGGCKVIGVAGSNGKTTTRHLIHHVLTHGGKRGTQSPKSFNNHLGVPLTLLAARPTDDFVACEIGTNHPGEIDFLSAIARPDIAVLVSLGEEHLEFFKDIEGVTKEEMSIAKHFDGKTQCMVGPSVPWHNTPLEPAVMRVEMHVHHAELLAREIEPTHEPTRQCAMLAAWVALAMGVEIDRVQSAMQCATTPPGRWQRMSLGQGVTLINDAYNANPSSVAEALDALSEQPGTRKVFIFGDMFELGRRAEGEHTIVGQAVATHDIDQFIAIGELAKHAFDAVSHDTPAQFFASWSDDLPEKIAALLQPGDTVLLKASRGMQLERLIPAIEARFGKALVPHS